MAIAAPSDEVIRLVEALGLRTKNTREVTLRMAVNEVVAVNTVEYVNGEQIGALAAELTERQYRLARWIPVSERLPEANGRYLVVSDPDGDPYPDAATWFEGEWWTGWSPSKKWGCDVTHWMPLPALPDGTTSGSTTH